MGRLVLVRIPDTEKKTLYLMAGADRRSVRISVAVFTSHRKINMLESK
jgi:hypothetical protein